jgi:glycosyltransferase involved in cell wall biosynthesis
MLHLPRISIVTPSYNQGEFLEQTLRSVIEQGYPNLDYRVIDGGSTDGSVEIIRRYADRLSAWVSEPDAGQADAINKGFARSTGEIMGWLNSDDLYMPDTLHIVGEIFAHFPQVAWISGLTIIINADGKITWRPRLRRMPTLPKFRGLIRRGWYHGRRLGFIQQEGTFWRRSLWDQAGGYLDVDRRYSMDFDLWRRFADHADLATVDATLAAFRQHGGQKTRDMTGYYAEIGVTIPDGVRIVMLPLRMAFRLALNRFAPRIVYSKRDGRWVLRNPVGRR